MSFLTTLSLLKNSNYRNYQVANFLFIFGLQVQHVMLGWYLFEQTGDPLSLGLLGLSEALTFLTFSLAGGHLADIYPRKNLVLLGVTGYCISSWFIGLIIFEKIPSFFDKATLIYIIIGITGIARGILSPGKSSWVAQLVKKEDYARASSVNGLFWQTAAVSGPAIGGLLISKGYEWPMAVCIIFPIIGFVLFYKIQHRGIPEKTKAEPAFQKIKQGIKFFFAQPVLLSAVTLDMFGVLFGGAIAMLPVFAKEVLNAGPEGLGWLRMAPPLGAVISGLIMMGWQPTKHAGKILLTVVTGFGVCMIAFALSNQLWLSFAFLALSGFLDQISVVIRHTILNIYTPDNMRGRVNAIHYIFIGSSNELGSFESGIAAKFLGLIPSVVAGGLTTLIITAFIAIKTPALRKLNIKLNA